MMTNVGKMYWWAKITVWIVVFWPLSANFLTNQAEVLYAVRFFVTPTDIILLDRTKSPHYNPLVFISQST